MEIEIREEPVSSMATYGEVPIAFTVERIYDVADGYPVFNERTVERPWVKDYDAYPGEDPSGLPKRFDFTNWKIFSARIDGRRVGGAIVAADSPGVHRLTGRSDLAVLWDIRIDPSCRGSGVGTALFRAVEAWARGRGCVELTVETQNVNVPACRFYERQGMRVGTVNRGAYAHFPDEIQVLWRKDL